VFQFPVLYEAMTVLENLSFPMRELATGEQRRRAEDVAVRLGIGGILKRRPGTLTLVEKQLVAIGKALMRPDVSLVLLDEPLTAAEPEHKWRLRQTLRALQADLGATMIYVTHDQTEALTFADQVVVMHEGTVVQIGTPVDLFERPRHTFVGHFIGSPGMNLLPARVENGAVMLGDRRVETTARDPGAAGAGDFEIGIRPEFVAFDETGLPVQVVKVSDAGRFRIVDTRHDGKIVRLLVDEGSAIPSDGAAIRFVPEMTHLYRDGRIVE
jgi:glycerol transport system ATP-binding protein